MSLISDQLQAWFKDIGKQIDSLNHEESTASGRKIVHLIQALQEVQGNFGLCLFKVLKKITKKYFPEFHNLDNNFQVRQFLQETRNILHTMLRSVNIKEEISIHLQVIADMSYAWHIMDAYTIFMQKGIKEEPSLVIKLRATFLKVILFYFIFFLIANS